MFRFGLRETLRPEGSHERSRHDVREIGTAVFTLGFTHEYRFQDDQDPVHCSFRLRHLALLATHRLLIYTA